MDASRVLLLSLLSVLFTWLNAVKPYVVDDRAYHYYAVEFAQHPVSPYGFHFHPKNIPGNNLLVPPVLPYWLALTAANGPEDPFIWKLWLLPFVLLFAFSLHSLYRRFATGLELPLVIMTLFSPTFFPALNLMLDIPALALGLGAMVCYLRGAEDRSTGSGWGWIILSGILAGLATQTKYTAFVPLGAIGLHALLFRHRLRGFAIGLIAVAFFVSWEQYVAFRHGESHFLVSYHRRSPRLFSKFNQIAPSIGIIGGLAPGLILLGASALRIARPWRVAMLIAIPVCFLLLGFVPESAAVVSYHPRTGMPLFSLRTIIFGVFGLVACGIALAVISRLLKETPEGNERLTNVFLVGWFCFEVIGAFALSPFQAARRWMGTIVVVSILMGRLLARTTAKEDCILRAIPAVIYSLVLGAFLYSVDFIEGNAEKTACQWAVEVCDERQAPMVWYVSDGSSFHYYAEEAGMKPWYPSLATPRPGDWVVMARHVDDKWSGMQELRTLANVHLVEEKEFGDDIPFQMQDCYYGGASAIEHHEGPRMQVKIFRWE